MAERGIIFSAPMVRALLDGHKTQTRRLFKPKAVATHIEVDGEARPLGIPVASRQGIPHAIGDRLYVRERLWVTGEGIKYGDATVADDFAFEAEVHHAFHPGRDLWLRKFNPDRAIGIPSIHMPRWASRLTLTVTDVRVQRVQEIGEQDSIDEGVEPVDYCGERAWKSYETYADGSSHPHAVVPNRSPITSYRELWNSLHTSPGQTWQDNPWVYALTFTVRRGNIDHLEALNHV